MYIFVIQCFSVLGLGDVGESLGNFQVNRWGNIVQMN